jgi:hypothetical protein
MEYWSSGVMQGGQPSALRYAAPGKADQMVDFRRKKYLTLILLD